MFDGIMPFLFKKPAILPVFARYIFPESNYIKLLTAVSSGERDWGGK